MEKNILQYGVKELTKMYSQKKISPVEVTKCLLAEIEKRKELNAFITLTEDMALIRAEESEKRYLSGVQLGPIDGIPYAAKDIFYTRGIRTTMGSEIYKNYIPDITATAIEKFDNAGGILLGKTNTHEFASGPTNDRTYFGPVKNPRNERKVPGGSSGGSAAAVAANLCPAALGSDTTGSIRLPAAACGLVGMKPTQGRISKYGVYPLSDSLDHVGALTRNVEDNAIVLSQLTGFDARDSWSLRLPQTDFTSELHEPIAGLKIGVPWKTFESFTDHTILASFEETLKVFEKLGAEIKNISLQEERDIYGDACRLVRICEAYTLHERNLKEKPEQYSAEVYTGSQYPAYEYIKALKMRKKFKQKFKNFMNSRDISILAMPTTPLYPTDIDQREVNINGKVYSIFSRYGLFTSIASFTGFPDLAMPINVNEENLCASIQLLGNELEEAKVYRFAYQLEHALALEL